jgi:hypothetical protein
MRDASAIFTALVADTDVTALGLTCNAMLPPLAPGLAYHLFSANSNDPAKLGITLARAMTTADQYLSQRGQAPGAITTGNPTVMPVSTPFYEACTLLWLASQPNFGFGVSIEILHIGALVAWSKGVAAAHIPSATLGPGPGLSERSQASSTAPSWPPFTSAPWQRSPKASKSSQRTPRQ